MSRFPRYLLYLVLFGALFSTSAQHPDILWTRRYGEQNNSYCRSVLTTDDSGFFLIGATEPMGSYLDLWLLKVDQYGLLEWDTVFGGNECDFGADAKRTLDGGLIITGWTESESTAGESHLWLLKLDSMGCQEWSMICDSAYSMGFSVQQTSDSGYVATGYMYNSSWDPDLYIVKTDGSGETEWEQSYGGDDTDIAWSIQQTSDGGFIITGYTFVGENDCDLWLIRTDNLGNIEWEKTYGDSLEEVGYSVCQTSDGGFITVGYSLSYATGADVFLLKTDDSGGVEWTASFGGSDWDRGDDVIQTMDGGYVLTGSTMSYGSTVQCLVIKTYATGDLEWECSIGDADHDEYGYSILQLSDGGFIVGGDERSLSTGVYNMLLVRLEPPSGACGENPLIPESIVLSSISPNPCCHNADIEFSLPVTACTNISVHDITGRRVRIIYQGVIPAGENHIVSWDGCDDTGFKVVSGVYFIRLESNDLAVTSKLVLLR